MLDLAALSPAQKLELNDLLLEVERRQNQRLLDTMFPTAGPLRRELYPKHLEFFGSGSEYRERVFLAGNRVGKTVGAGCEWSYHLTGEYPAWWDGYRFDRPIRVLASGDTHETTRDIIQAKMLGGTTDQAELIGTGLIPGRHIVGWVPRPHVKGAIEKVMVRHMPTGKTSELWLRSYVQGREIFQGFELDGFWPDEECPQDVYEEALVRLMTRRGLSTLTFTPLNGLTQLVQEIKRREHEGGIGAPKLVSCTWDDVPHLDELTKAEMLAKLAPFQRDARTKGIPSLGSGAIFPVAEEDIVVQDFQIPPHWVQAYGLDVGWNRTAAIFGAWDRDNDVLYLTSEHYRGQAEPSIHAEAIKARGKWIPGVIDPASRGRAQADGKKLLDTYLGHGLKLTEADNAVEAGLLEMWQRLSTGRLKVFASLSNWRSEYRLYRRDDKGRVVKQNDHAMDGSRYLVMSGLAVATTEPNPEPRRRERNWRTA